MLRTRRSKTSRRRKGRAHARRRNPSRRKRVKVRAHVRRRNPSTRRRSTRRRRNPSFSSALKTGMNKQFLMNALLTSIGLILGTKTASVIQHIPFMDKFGRFSGALNIVIGGVLAGLVKNPHAKSVFVGFAAGGAYNLIATNVAAAGISQISGDELLGVEVGDRPLVPMAGVEVGGEAPYVVMAGDGNSSWGGPSW